jgi:hypothetical protein
MDIQVVLSIELVLKSQTQLQQRLTIKEPPVMGTVMVLFLPKPAGFDPGITRMTRARPYKLKLKFSFRQPITLPAGEFTDESDFVQPQASSPSPSPSTTTTAISQPPVPVPVPTTSLLRLTSSINSTSTLFSNELEYLYIAKGFGEAFEFLFDSSESLS